MLFRSEGCPRASAATLITPIVSSLHMPPIRHSTTNRPQKITLPLPHPLPPFQATTLDRTPKLGRIKVLDHPRVNGKGQQTWTVDEEPVSTLQCNSLVILYNSSYESGIGRLSAIVDLRRHWVTFTVAGAQYPAFLRVPAPWTTLEGLAAFSYSAHFNSLPFLPGPPASIQRHSRNRAARTVPLIMPPTASEKPEEVMSRITKITHGSRRGLD